MVVIGFLKEDCKVLEVRDDREGKPCAGRSVGGGGAQPFWPLMGWLAK